MPRTRDVTALSAILLAPLAALLIAHPTHEPTEPVAAEAPITAPAPTVAPAQPAPVAAPEPPAPIAAPEPPAAAAPTEPEPEPQLPATSRDPGQVMLLHNNALVLHTAPDPTWSSGKLSVTARSAQLIAARKAQPDRLPEPVRAVLGATISVFAADGSACVANAGAPRVEYEQLGEVYMDMSEDELCGEDGCDTTEPPKNRAAIRKYAEEHFADNHASALLLARQTNQAGKPCTGLWARRADLPAPAVFGSRPLAEDDARALAARVLEVVRAQPEFAGVEAAYAARLADYGPDAGLPSWDEFVTHNLRAARWDEVGGPRRLVTVELHEWPEGCGDFFEPSIFLMLEERDGALVRLAQPSWSGLTAVMDLDRDGVFEAVREDSYGGYALVAAGPTAEAYRDEFMIDYLGCRC